MITRRRSGFTVLEVMISIGIFVVVMSLVMDTLTTMTGYTTQESAQTDMTVRGRQATLQITNDIANSAWFYAYDSTLHQYILTPYPANSVGWTPPLPYQNNPLLPYVWPDTTTTGGIPNAGTIYEKDTLEYTKIRTSDAIAASPLNEHYSSTAFYTNGSLNPFTTLDNFATAPPSPLLILNDAYPGSSVAHPGAPGPNDIYISHVWESSLSGLTFDQNLTSSYVRHYHLEVVNVATVSTSPLVQTGQLVRTYWTGEGAANPAGGNDNLADAKWVTDNQPPLLYDVQSFVVHTPYQLAPNTSLGPNTISITIVQAKQTATPGTFVYHTMDFVCAMRSITRQ